MASKKKTTDARFSQFFQPVLDAIGELGGSARPSEVKEWILKNRDMPEDYATAVHKGGESKFGNDVDWARFYLVRAEYLDASERGVWSLTDKGESASIDPELATQIIRQVDSRGDGLTSQEAEPSPTSESSYVEKTLRLLQSLPPNGFERLCQRLLRESGFEEVKVTGRSGDGGIDGQGILQLNSFVSFRVLFQCKRYKDAVTPSVVRDFRGAMAGRAEKGIILTTGYFTPQAEAEASRDGAQPIELVDGEHLVRLLAQLRLGLKPVQSYEIDELFFRPFHEHTIEAENQSKGKRGQKR